MCCDFCSIFNIYIYNLYSLAYFKILVDVCESCGFCCVFLVVVLFFFWFDKIWVKDLWMCWDFFVVVLFV